MFQAMQVRLEALRNSPPPPVTAVDDTSSTPDQIQLQTGKGAVFHWNNRFNRLPEDYSFPVGVNSKVIWDLYFFGERNLKLVAFKWLEYRDFGGTRKVKANNVTYFTKSRTVVNVIAFSALKAEKFVVPGYSVDSRTAIPRQTLDRALAGKSFTEMSDICQVGHENLLDLVHSGRGRSVQISNFILNNV
jgi:hypothetical protein